MQSPRWIMISAVLLCLGVLGSDSELATTIAPDTSASSTSTPAPDASLCAEQSCPQSQLWDSDACSCVCKAQECPGNLQQDTETCDCKCPVRTCPDGYTWDLDTCSCQCSAATQCANGQQFDGTQCKCVGTCAPLTPCLAGTTWDYNSCSCSNTCVVQVCPIGMVWDTALCSCAVSLTSVAPLRLRSCPARYCPIGVMDLSTCLCTRSVNLAGGCVVRACPLGMSFNIATCDCRLAGLITGTVVRPLLPVIRPLVRIV